MPVPLTLLTTTSTFRQWFDLTNNLTAILNSSTVTDNAVAYGTFTIGANSNTSLAVAGVWTVNTTAIMASAAMTLKSNVTITSNALNFTVASNTFTVSPLTGTTINSPLTVNATSTFTSNVSVNAAVSLAGTVQVVGPTTLIGNVLVSNGIMNVQQVRYGSANAICAPATLASPSYNDYNPSGLDGAELLALTANVDVAFTGLQAPSGLTGARTLYVQNLSSTNNLVFKSANTLSQLSNRFQTPNLQDVVLSPGAMVELMWSSSAGGWQVISPLATTFPNLVVSGTTLLNGNVTVNASALFLSNTVFNSGLLANSGLTLNGTLTGGSISGTTVNASGLNVVSQTTGDLLYFNGSVWGRFGVGGSGTFLSGGSTPSWGKIPALSTTYFSSLDGGTLTGVHASALIGGPNTVAISTGSSLTPNVDQTSFYTVTSLASSVTFNTPAGTPGDGQKLIIRVTDNGVAHPLGWASGYASGGSTLPSVTVAGKATHIGLIYNSSIGKWLCVGAQTSA